MWTSSQASMLVLQGLFHSGARSQTNQFYLISTLERKKPLSSVDVHPLMSTPRVVLHRDLEDKISPDCLHCLRDVRSINTRRIASVQLQRTAAYLPERSF